MLLESIRSHLMRLGVMESEFKLKLFDIVKTSTPSGRISEDGIPGGDTILNMILENWDQYEKINVYKKHSKGSGDSLDLSKKRVEGELWKKW